MKNLLIGAFFLTLLLSGCSSKVMTNTLFGINSEYDPDGYPWQVQQTRLLNVHGLSPIQEVGEIYGFNPIRGVETAIPLLNEDLNISLYKKVIDYSINDDNTTMDDLYEIKSTLLKLDKLALDIAKAEVRFMMNVYRSDNNKSDIYDENVTQTDKKISILHASFDGNYSKFLEDQNKSGILIAQWTSSDEKNSDANASGVISFSSGKSKNFHGFIIASGLKIESLYISKKAANDLEDKFNDSLGSRVGITTYIASAKNFLFVNRLNHKKLLQAMANLDLKDLSSTDAVLKKLTNISVGLTIAKSENLFSSASYVRPRVTKCIKDINGSKPASWKDIKDSSSSSFCSESNLSTIPFFSVFTELDELDNFYE